MDKKQAERFIVKMTVCIWLLFGVLFFLWWFKFRDPPIEEGHSRMECFDEGVPREGMLGTRGRSVLALPE